MDLVRSRRWLSGNRRPAAHQPYPTQVAAIHNLGPKEYSTHTQYTSIPIADQDESNLAHVGRSFRTHWNPTFLRRRVLATFTLLFALIFAALQKLYSYSTIHQGIASSNNNEHYLWTYGPTAILVLVTVFWRQVEYSAKSMQPWAEMAKGPTVPNRSLLLDYLTPLQIFSLWRALCNRHFLVAATITIFFLLKCLIVISTGLLNLEFVQFGGIVAAMQVRGKFSGGEFRAGAHVDSRPAYTIYGIQSHNLSYPAGTTDEYAVQLFSPIATPVDNKETHSALVDVFSSHLECESGQLTYTINLDVGTENGNDAEYYNISVSTSDCEIHHAHLDAPNFNDEYDNGTFYGYYGQFQDVICSNLAHDDVSRNRIMVALAYSQVSVSTQADAAETQIMLNSSNIVCKPTYAIESASVSLDAHDNVVAVDLAGNTPRRIDAVSGYDIAKGVLMSIKSSNYLEDDNSSSGYYLDAFFSLIKSSNSRFEVQSLLDPETLESTTKAVYRKIAVQIAATFLMDSGSSIPTISGTISKTERRLMVHTLPTKLMETISILMLSLALYVTLNAPKGVLSRSPDSIAALATILARSPSINGLFKDSGYLDLGTLRKKIADHRFWTATSVIQGLSTFYIETEKHSVGPGRAKLVAAEGEHVGTLTTATSRKYGLRKTPSNLEISVSWVKPFSLSPIAKIAFLIVPTTFIIVAEVLLRISKHRSGLVDVDDNSLERYGWLYLPTLLLILLGTMFNMLDSDVELFGTYHTLSLGYCNANSSILQNPLRSIPVWTAFQALREGRFTILAASTSVLIAPFLTIVVSGLFSAETVPVTQSMSVHVVDWFNTTGSGIPNSGAAIVASLVTEGNMSYPPWTYGNLALPRIEIRSNETNVGDASSGSISVLTPAIRGGLDCTTLPQGAYGNISLEPSLEGSARRLRTNNGYISVPETGYFGYVLNNPGGGSSGSQSLAIYYGQVSTGDLQHFTVLFCNGILDVVHVNASFNLPGYSLSMGPAVLPGSPQSFTNNYDASTAYTSINNGFEPLNASNDTFDSFFQALVYGKDGVPAAELTNTTSLIRAMDSLFGIFAAQTVNVFYRSILAALPAKQTDVPGPLNATYTDMNRARLIQSALSTRLLQGLLGALLLCAIVVFLTVDMRKVLPKPVGSIAAVASLLAGSRLLDENEGIIPPGAEWMNDKEWGKREIWKDEQFRMGWWDDFAGEGEGGESGQRVRRFRIDVRPKDR